MDGLKTAVTVTLFLLVFFISSYASAEAVKLDFTTDRSEYKTGDTIKIRGTTDAANVTISIVGLFPLDAVKIVSASGGFKYDYETLPGDYGRVLIRAETGGGAGKEKQVFVQKNAGDSALDVELITPANNERFYRENNLTIKLRVTDNGVAVNDANVYCKLQLPGPAGANRTLELFPVGEFFTDTYQISAEDIESGGVYYTDYPIARGDPTQVWVIKCVAQKAEKQGGISRPARVVNNLILIDFLSPSQAVVESGAGVNIIVRAYYQDGNPVKNTVVLIEDSDGRSAGMEKLSDSGIYEFKGYDTTSDNSYIALAVTAVDDVGNAGKNSVILRVARNNLPDMLSKFWWAVPMVITIMLLTIYLEKQVELSYGQTISRPGKLRGQITELEEEKQNITESRASVEENYYKRKIDEKTFRRMMEDYEQKSIELDIRIRRLKQELKEFE